LPRRLFLVKPRNQIKASVRFDPTAEMKYFFGYLDSLKSFWGKSAIPLKKG
jgi:hypothetical protein